jgi:hypothetical protein
MNQTEIKIVQYNSSGQVIASFDLDLFDSVPIPVSKSIVDIKEPEKRKSDYTLSIQIPATANNRSIFSNIQNIGRTTINSSSTNFSPDFNVNLKAEAIVLKNGIVQTRGYLQLTEIPINDQDIEFEIIIIGKLANLFQDLGEKKMPELNLSQYDHAWTYGNIANSWSNYIIKNGVAYNNFDASGNPNGEGYVYPLIDNGNSTNARELEYTLERSMYPAVYFKTIVDTIFSEAGYRYHSNFFNSNLFKRLIMPFTGGDFRSTISEVNDRIFTVGNSADLNFTTTSTSYISESFRYDFDTIVQNTTPTGVDIANNKYIIPTGNNGKYAFNWIGTITLTNDTSDPIIGDASVLIMAYRKRGSTLTTLSSFYYNEALFTFDSTPPGGSLTNDYTFSSREFDFIHNDEIYFEVSWYIRTAYNITTSANLLANELSLTIAAGAEFSSSPSVVYFEGQDIGMSSVMPPTVKQTEFLSWLFYSFNLYAIPDQLDPQKLIIEPRDDFYISDAIDLTNYLDMSKEMTIKPMGSLDFKEFIVKYKEDKDEYNSKYQNVFGEPYSTKRIKIENDFLTATKAVEVGFSASPLSNSIGTHDRVYTKIRSEVPLAQDADLPSFNVRMLYYGGLVTTTKGWTLKTTLSGNINFAVDFPYAGMLDSVSNPTLDLSFAQPRAIFFGLGQITYTNGNLYNRYWAKTIAEITDLDSKLITAQFHLTPVQLANLDFRKNYLIDRQYYRLYSVNYDLNSDEPATIELLKLKTAPSFSAATATGNGGSGGVLTDEPLPMFLRYDNSRLYQDTATTNLTITEMAQSIVYLDFNSSVYMITADSPVYLPDANQARGLTGNCSIVVKNLAGSKIVLYPSITTQTINGANHFDVMNYHSVTLVAFNGNWQVLNIVNTGGG